MNDIITEQIDMDIASTSESTPTKQKKLVVPDAERWAFSVREAEAKTGLSRAWLYERIRDGSLRVVKRNGRTWVPATALREFLGM
jgi:hypothetical protein